MVCGHTRLLFNNLAPPNPPYPTLSERLEKKEEVAWGGGGGGGALTPRPGRQMNHSEVFHKRRDGWMLKESGRWRGKKKARE